MAAPASTECRHPEASEEAIGGSAGAAADHMHAATADVVAAGAGGGDLSRVAGCVGAQPSNPAWSLEKKIQNTRNLRCG